MTEQPENGFNVVVRTLTDLDSGRLEWERALAESDPDEREAAIRILRLPAAGASPTSTESTGSFATSRVDTPGIGDD
jgi:hypothetical protein